MRHRKETTVRKTFAMRKNSVPSNTRDVRPGNITATDVKKDTLQSFEDQKKWN